MKNLFLAGFVAVSLISCNQSVSSESASTETDKLLAQTDEKSINDMEKKSFYDFKVQTLDGSIFDFSSLKGKRVLVVNTASECGYTPQYEALQELYETYKDNDFMIVGFPSNDFGAQEPGSDADIASFCKKNYGVTFPMMTKSPVTGEDKNEVYKWLTSKAQNGKESAEVSWNFNKFLIDENGIWVAHYPSNVKPLDEQITSFAKG